MFKTYGIRFTLILAYYPLPCVWQELKDHKDNKGKAKAGAKVKVDEVRIRLEEALNAVPKYEDKPPSVEVLRELVLEWLKKRKRAKAKAQREWQDAHREYQEKMAELEVILAARQAMGAAQREDMPVKPIMPVFILFPSKQEVRSDLLPS